MCPKMTPVTLIMNDETSALMAAGWSSCARIRCPGTAVVAHSGLCPVIGDLVAINVFGGVHDEHADDLCAGSEEAVEPVGLRGCNDFAGLPAGLGEVFGRFKR